MNNAQENIQKEEEEQKEDNNQYQHRGCCNKQTMLCKTTSSVANSFKTTSTLEGQEIASIDSRKKASINNNTEDKTSVITSA